MSVKKKQWLGTGRRWRSERVKGQRERNGHKRRKKSTRKLVEGWVKKKMNRYDYEWTGQRVRLVLDQNGTEGVDDISCHLLTYNKILICVIKFL